MNRFVDTHNHALWGMDDGVKDQSEALDLLLSAQKSHIGVLFVTPHFIPEGIYEPSTQKIVEATNNLRELAQKHQIEIEIRSGCEFRINEYAMDAIATKRYTPFEGTDYVLIEFVRQNAKSRMVIDAIDELRVQGKKCIIAHPERYFDDPKETKEYVHRWIELGCVISVNRTSLINEHRTRNYNNAWVLVQSGLAHIIATDAHHGIGARMCLLDDIHHEIEQKLGKEVADTFFFTNPWHIANNEPVEQIVIQKKKWRLFG